MLLSDLRLYLVFRPCVVPNELRYDIEHAAKYVPNTQVSALVSSDFNSGPNRGDNVEHIVLGDKGKHALMGLLLDQLRKSLPEIDETAGLRLSRFTKWRLAIP